jgi:hypothetical protein
VRPYVTGKHHALSSHLLLSESHGTTARLARRPTPGFCAGPRRAVAAVGMVCGGALNRADGVWDQNKLREDTVRLGLLCTRPRTHPHTHRHTHKQALARTHATLHAYAAHAHARPRSHSGGARARTFDARDATCDHMCAQVLGHGVVALKVRRVQRARLGVATWQYIACDA